MGAIAEATVAYAQPLLDDTDGSADQVERAFAIAQLCWNLALVPEEEREVTLTDIRQTFTMSDKEFEDFRHSVILPMIQRHHEMFPNMPRLGSMVHSSEAPAPQTRPTTPPRTEKYPGTGRNAPCPCRSGKKYKRCCGR